MAFSVGVWEAGIEALGQKSASGGSLQLSLLKDCCKE